MSDSAGYYSMQCVCGFWSSAHLKPQSQWTDEEVQREVAHQQFHILQQAVKLPMHYPTTQKPI